MFLLIPQQIPQTAQPHDFFLNVSVAVIFTAFGWWLHSRMPRQPKYRATEVKYDFEEWSPYEYDIKKISK